MITRDSNKSMIRNTLASQTQTHGMPFPLDLVTCPVLSKKKCKMVWKAKGDKRDKYYKVTRFESGYAETFHSALNSCRLVHVALPWRTQGILFHTPCSNLQCEHPHWIIEPFIPGTDLATWSIATLSPSIRTLVKRQIRSIFLDLQKNKVIHQDIKMGNIIVSEGRKPKVWLIDNEFAISEGHRSLYLMGTPSFMAPELLYLKEHASLKSDIWLYGILLLNLNTNRHVLRAMDLTSVGSIFSKKCRRAMMSLVELYYPENFRKWSDESLHRSHRLWYLDEALIAIQVKRIPIKDRVEIEMALYPEPHKRRLKVIRRSVWKLFCC